MDYKEKITSEVAVWKHRMAKRPSFTGELGKQLQNRINKAIPEKIHEVITGAIKQMTKAVITGAGFTNPPPLENVSLEHREVLVHERIKFYSNTAAAEGAITGAGGILLGLADFPIWLTIKMKMLFEIAALYGYDVTNLRERIYILYIFQLTFSSQRTRNDLIQIMESWSTHQGALPDRIDQFDWRSFQQEYRDYIDIAKLLQLVPGIGAAVGAVVNLRLTNKLGETAMNAYRLRLTQS
jgi:uncharacterized protein (DUF697 family)